VSTRQTRIEIRASGGDQVDRELRQIGDTGGRAFDRLKRASEQAQPGLLGVDRASAALRRTASGLTSGLATLTSRLGGLGAIAASVAGSAGLGLIVRRNLELAERLDDVAKRTDFGVERLQALRFAFDKNGVAMAETDAGLRRFTRRLGLAADKMRGLSKEGGAAYAAIQSYGIAILDAEGKTRSSEAVFDDVVGLLSSFESQAKRSALASQFFGEDAGPAMAVLLGQGSHAIARYERQLRDMGGILSKEVVEQGAQAAVELRALNQVVSTNFSQGVLRGFVGEFGSFTDLVKDPAFQDGLRGLGEIVGQMSRFALEHGETLVRVGTALAGAKAGGAIGGVIPHPAGRAVGAVGGAAVGALAPELLLGATRSPEELRSNLGRLESQREALSGEIQRQMQAARFDQDPATVAMEFRSQLAQVEQRIAQTTSALKAMHRANTETSQSTGEATAATADRAAGVAHFREQLDAEAEALQAARKAEEASTKARTQAIAALADLRGGLERDIAVLRVRRTQGEDAARVFSEEASLRRQLNDLVEASSGAIVPREVEAVAQLLHEKQQLNSVIVAEAEARELARQAAEREANERERERDRVAREAERDAERAARDAQREAERVADQMAQPFLNAAEGIQRGFSDALFNVFRGEENRDLVDGFLTYVKDAFARMVAEIATLAIARSVIHPLVGAIGGSLLPSGASASLLQGLGAGGGGGGGFGLPPIGSFFSGATSAIDAFGVGFGFAPAPGSLTGAAAAHAGAAAQSGIFGTSATLSGTLGAAGLGALGGGLLASFTGGNQIGGSIGGALGSAAGFMIGGPVGGLIGGAAGGLLGGMFGGGPSDKTQAATVQLATGAITNVGGLSGKKFSAENREAVDQIAAAVASAVRESGGLPGGGEVEVIVGSRDGLRFRRNGQLTNVGQGSADDLLSAIMQSIGPELEDARELQGLKALVEQLLGPDGTDNALQELAASFDKLRVNAGRLGLTVKRINDAEDKILREMESAAVSTLRGLATQQAQLLGIAPLQSLRDDLSLGALSPLSSGEQLRLSRAELGTTASAALGGDLDAVGRFPTLARSVLDLGRQVFASGPDFQSLAASVESQLGSLLTRQESLQSALGPEIVIALRDSAQDQMAALNREITRVVDELAGIRREFVR